MPDHVSRCNITWVILHLDTWCQGVILPGYWSFQTVLLCSALFHLNVQPSTTAELNCFTLVKQFSSANSVQKAYKQMNVVYFLFAFVACTTIQCLFLNMKRQHLQ